MTPAQRLVAGHVSAESEGVEGIAPARVDAQVVPVDPGQTSCQICSGTPETSSQEMNRLERPVCLVFQTLRAYGSKLSAFSPMMCGIAIPG